MKCHGMNGAGKPCGAPAVGGTSHCLMHSGRAAELGSRGGRRRTVYNPDCLKEFPAPKSAADLRDTLAQSIVELRTGKMDPKVANALGYLGASYLRALELADIESRLEKMEAQLDYAAQAISHVRGQGGSDRA